MTHALILNGQPSPPARAVLLHCGGMTVRYSGGALRSISAGNTLVLNQIYAAVRDQNWDTIAGVLHDEIIEQDDSSFRITFRSEHQRGEIDFGWDGTITGTADGVLTFHFRGEARSTFKRNRIGFCVLHPLNAAGQPCRIDHVDGSITEAHFPTDISPHQPFFSIRTVHHEVMPGLWAETRMEGDTFEMEDQRQWIDASFKTYCTPLAQPFPATVSAGTLIEQQITVRLHGTIPEATSNASRPVTITFGSGRSKLPKIGLCVADGESALSTQSAERLRALRLDHLRVDLQMMQAGWKERLNAAASDAVALGCAVELAVHITDDAEAQLTALRDALSADRTLIAHILIFHASERSTSAKWVTLARTVLNVSVPVGGGTDAFFTELNRGRPDAQAFDVISYSSNPQVHAFDDDSLVETLAVLPITAATAASFSGGKPIVLSPLTFRMRWNPNATGDPALTPAGELPVRYDARQMSLFGAAWTLGSLSAVSRSSLSGVTWFETTGWGGIMAGDVDSALPEKFPAQAGDVYPMYHVFADVGEFRDGDVLAATSSARLRVEVLALSEGTRVRIILANFTPDTQNVTLEHPPVVRITARRLDQQHAAQAMREPDAYRADSGETLDASDGNLTLTLAPYGLITLDGSTA